MQNILIYLDPGSGSLLFQALLSGLLTVLVFFKQIAAYIKVRFGGRKSKKSDLDNLD